MHSSMYVHTQIHMHVCRRLHAHTAHPHARKHTLTYTRTHTHTHTFTRIGTVLEKAVSKSRPGCLVSNGFWYLCP